MPSKTERPVDLLLDSGVFSAWNREEPPLDLKQYIAFIKANLPWLWAYVSMDVIPGKFGQRKSQAEVEASASGGYRNFQIMKDAGLNPVPVFHQGERLEWLERYVNEGERYVGISTAKDLRSTAQVAWLDDVFSRITDKQGRALIRTHGFGITTPALLLQYPFYTVDSTTWSVTPGFGQVIVPVYEGGKPNYHKLPIRVNVSGVEQQSKSVITHEGLGPTARAAVERFLIEATGCGMGEIRYSTAARRKALLYYFKQLMLALPDVRYKRHDAGSRPIVAKMKAIDHIGLKIFCATLLNNRQFGVEMNEQNVRLRLLSYYELKQKPPGTLQEYVERGKLGEYAPRAPRMNWYGEGYLNFRRLRLLKRLDAYDQQTDVT